ncbi:unnamed protein product [Clonostachys chloroleuca]|uniref:Arylsulfatase n=1 Tax=Clonostachys chloroleuca TaxID=1926264 RepID=A0AA35Q1Y3_9HYPO|nr:unnamed protein product [Clonostachys chloroleuca]
MRFYQLLPAIALLGFSEASEPLPSKEKPNIMFVILDDLDYHMTDLSSVMPSVKKHIIDQGTTFPNHYCQVSLCCPARASILTGQTAHNHNVTDVHYPSGGYQKFYEQKFNKNYLPVWLQEAGYGTYYVGKLLNDISIQNYNNPYVNGWDGIDVLLDPFAYDFWSPAFARNKDPWQRYSNNYTTDLVSLKSMGFLEDALADDKPFFLGVAPIAPHSEVLVNTTSLTATFSAPKPATRHIGKLVGAQVPRTDNFNPDKPSGASWIKTLDQLNNTEVQQGDEWYQARLESLLAVDEMVDSLFAKLEDSGKLDNTYVIFTSDNGFHIGQHRLSPGKTCGYEEDINVPFIVRGPGIAKGHTMDVVSGHIDIAPTILEMAGISLRDTFDGSPIPLNEDALKALTKPKTEHTSIEMWRSNNQSFFRTGRIEMMEEATQNTYKSVRLVSGDHNLYYSVWCTNEHELYDMKASSDSQQMNNLFEGGFGGSYETADIVRLAHRLDALLYVLKSCRGDSCRYPWESLMPLETVTSLSGAMNSQYDEFFETLPKVSFSSCQQDHIIEAEGPQFETWTVEGSKTIREMGRGWDPVQAWMT